MVIHSRKGDPKEVETDSVIVGHAQAANNALTFLKSWIGVIALLIGVGWEAERIVGKVESAEKESNDRFIAAEKASNIRFSSIEKSVDDFKTEIRQKIKDTGTDATNANNDARDLKNQISTAQKDIDGLKHDVQENYKIMMTFESKKGK